MFLHIMVKLVQISHQAVTHADWGVAMAILINQQLQHFHDDSIIVMVIIPITDHSHYLLSYLF